MRLCEGLARPARYGAALLLISILSATAQGQVAQIDQLVAEALLHNPGIRSLAADRVDAEGQVIAAETWENPEFSAEPGIKNIPSSAEEAGDSFYTGAYSVGQKFLFPGKRALAVAVAEHDVKISSAALDQFRYQLELQVRKAAADLLISQELVSLRKRQHESAAVFSAATKKRVANGYASDFDAIKGESELIAAERMLSEANTNEQKFRLALNGLTGRLLTSPLNLTGSFRTPQVSQSRSALLEVALSKNPAIQTQSLKIRRAELNTDSVKKSRYPDFTVGPSIEYGKDERVYAVGISMPLPIWDASTGAVQSAAAQQRKESIELEKLKLEIGQAVSEAHQEFLAASNEEKLFSRGFIERLEQALKQAQTSYESNTTTLLIYLDAKRTYFDSLAAHYEILTKLSDSFFELQSAVGVPLPLQ